MTTPQHRHQFEDVPGPKLNVGCGFDIRPAEKGWTNLDGFVEREGVVKHDILRLPWPFESASFDLVYCSHVLEHVPPIVTHEGGTQRDILFRVFEEIHRVLRPRGLLVVRVPWGYSQSGMEHIQHYRQWRPEWAYYFHPDHEENAYSSARFELVEWRRTRGTTAVRAPYFLRFGRGPMKLSLTTHLRDRLPFLKPLLEKPTELEMRLRKV